MDANESRVRSADTALRLLCALLAMAALSGFWLGYLFLVQGAGTAPCGDFAGSSGCSHLAQHASADSSGSGFAAEPMLAEMVHGWGRGGALEVPILIGTFLFVLIAACVVLIGFRRRMSEAGTSDRPWGHLGIGHWRTGLLDSERLAAAEPAHKREVQQEETGEDRVDPRDLLAEIQALGAEIKREVGEVSHAMRTPLAVIAGSADAVRRALPQGTEKARRSVDLIALSCERLVDILDAHRDETAELIDSFLGSQVSIDVGAFVQDFIARARIAAQISLVHPPQALYARTQARCLKELLHHLLVRSESNRDAGGASLSLHQEGDWVLVVIEYGSVEDDTVRPPAALPGVDFALRGQRLRLSLMGATLRRTIDQSGLVRVTLALPAVSLRDEVAGPAMT